MIRRLFQNLVLATALSALLTAAIYQKRVGAIAYEAATAGLWSDWNTINLALRIGPHGPDWIYERQDDPAQVLLMKRLREIYMLADEQGRPLQYANLYQHLTVPPFPITQNPHFWQVKNNGIFGGKYLLCTAPIRFPGGRIYRLTVARAI